MNDTIGRRKPISEHRGSNVGVDSYLDLAEAVLRTARHPMTAQQILKHAYLGNIVPPQLHGRTQHKTLGARLSEDILLRRERSMFFRTAPGCFFLTSYLTDPTIPKKFRTPLIARRRRRELLQGRALTIRKEAVPKAAVAYFPPVEMLRELKKHHFQYRSSLSEQSPDEYAVWSFVMVTKGKSVLTYRQGRYRENRDAFLLKRSVGFFTPVVDNDYDLFDEGDYGIIASGLKAVIIDLDMPRLSKDTLEYARQTRLECFIRAENETRNDLLALIRFECPSWFEPLGRRLAINDLHWMDLLMPVNHIADFDPWSQHVLDWAHSSTTE